MINWSVSSSNLLLAFKDNPALLGIIRILVSWNSLNKDKYIKQIQSYSQYLEINVFSYTAPYECH